MKITEFARLDIVCLQTGQAMLQCSSSLKTHLRRTNNLAHDLQYWYNTKSASANERQWQLGTCHPLVVNSPAKARFEYLAMLLQAVAGRVASGLWHVYASQA